MKPVTRTMSEKQALVALATVTVATPAGEACGSAAIAPGIVANKTAATKKGVRRDALRPGWSKRDV